MSSDQLSMFSAEDDKAVKLAERKKRKATDKFKDELLPVTPARKEIIDRLFTRWQLDYGYKRAKLTKERTICLNARLYHGFTESELTLVLTFVKDLPFWRGQNDRNKPYDDLSILFGNNERTERLLVQARGGKKDVDRRATHLAANDKPTTTENF